MVIDLCLRYYPRVKGCLCWGFLGLDIFAVRTEPLLALLLDICTHTPSPEDMVITSAFTSSFSVFIHFFFLPLNNFPNSRGLWSPRSICRTPSSLVLEIIVVGDGGRVEVLRLQLTKSFVFFVFFACAGLVYDP